jgi:hypothetical protein
MKVINAIYNFIVGDMIILIGVLAVAIVLGIINFVSAFAGVRFITGPLLILAVLGVLIGTLSREVSANRKLK